MTALRVAVAEDEPANLRRLVRLLQECGCEVIACFENGLDMEEWLVQQPEVDGLFLDVRMPELDGLSLRASIRPDLPVVFVTSHPEHAVEAFNVSAVDFLLKPVTTERLAKALDRIRRARSLPSPLALPKTPAPLAQAEDPPADGRYAVLDANGVRFKRLDATEFFEVDRTVVWAQVDGQRHHTRWRTLGEVEAAFPDAGLLRIHRHLLIRLEAVQTARPAGDGHRILVRMASGVELEASRGMTPILKARLPLH